MKRLAALPLRTQLWLAGTLVSLLAYGTRATHLPRRTAVGVEQRVLAGSGYLVQPLPTGGRWLVSLPPPSPPSIGTRYNPGEHFANWLWNLEWPGGRITGRRLAPFREQGTWALDPLGLRRVWRYRADEIRDGRFLMAGPEWNAASNSEVHAPILDLHSRRTLIGDDAVRALGVDPTVDEYEWSDDYQGNQSVEAESAGLEGIGPELTEPLDVVVDGRELTLWLSTTGTGPTAVLAVSDGPTPAILRLAENASHTLLSADGRVLFFERDGALWRLDLRRPLPELLNEATPPPLPEPSP